MIKPGIIVAVDFDGTVVTHEFPKIGKELPYCVETLKKIVDAGGRLILLTMRCNHDRKPVVDKNQVKSHNQVVECDAGNYLYEAVNWFKERGIALWAINENPEQKKWTSSPKVYAHLIIDDTAVGTHTMHDPNFAQRPYVDWVMIDALLFPEEF